MSTVLDLLSGELERLFSSAEMKDLCVNYLDVDPSAQGLEDAAKSIFAKKIVSFCEKSEAVEAMAETILSLKKGTVDPRLQQFLHKGLSPDDLKPETKLGEYWVQSKLGDNEIGAAYDCYQPELGQRFRLTVLRKDRAENKHSAQRYLMLMRLLKHQPRPSVASVKEVGVLADGRPYAISAVVEGDSAADRVPMSPSRALRLLEGICDALDSLHSKGIVHGNLNVNDIYILSGEDEDAEVVLTGLGADRLISMSAPPIGIAPEMLRNGRADARSDIYTLGALLYELVTGKPMFEGALPIDIAAAHLVQTPPSIGDSLDDPSAAALDKFVTLLTAKDPMQRLKSMDLVRRKLEDVKHSVEQLEARAAATGSRDDLGLSLEAFQQNPTDPGCLNALLTEARSANAWGVVVEVIEEAASKLNDPDQANILLATSADIAFKKMKNYDHALSTYEYFLSANPNDEVILNAAMDVLEAAGRYEGLVEKLTAKAETCTDPEERVALLKRIAVLYEKKLKNPEAALGYYMGCLTGTASDLELLSSLEKTAEASGQYENLAASLAQAAGAAEGAGDADTALALYEKLGGIYLNKLDQAGYALTCFQKVLEFRPGDAETLKAVADLYRGAQQWAELAQVTMSLAEMESEPNLRRNYMAEAADLYYKRLGNGQQAVSLLEGVLAEDPGHQAALDIMAEILTAAQDYPRLVNVLSGSLQAISHPADQTGVRVRLGTLCENQLGDLDAAKAHYEKCVEADPECLDALKGLDRIYLKERNTVGLRDTLEAELLCEMSPKQASEIRVRLADLYEEEFKNYGKAVEHLETVIAADDTHRYALLTLTRLYRREERWEDLVNLLENPTHFCSE